MDSLEMTEHDRLILELAKQQVFDLNAKIGEVEQRIARLAENDHSIKLLVSLPGVSLMTAACLVGAIGEVVRFRDGDHLAAYFGLVPRVKQSADHCYYGSITKVGNNQVRKMLVLAARNLRTHPGPLGAYFRRMGKHKRINVAATATARKIGDGGIPIAVDGSLVLKPEECRAFLRGAGIDGEIVWTPGHSPDSISLVLDEGRAFTGDLTHPLLLSDEDDACRDSRVKLSALGARMIYPAHGKALCSREEWNRGNGASRLYWREWLSHATLCIDHMKHTILPLETVNALVTEPSVAFGIEGRPDIAALSIKSPTGEWGSKLDAVVDGCLVLGFTKMVLDLQQAEIATSFSIACIASAWQRLINHDGTLVMYGLTPTASLRFQELIEPGLFNVHENLDACVDWLDSGFRQDLERNFPRIAKCSTCGAVGQIANRGDHVCTECGMTYLVTERGELPF
jgi:DNA-directed RNA polymerase subunit RPC12/RpoP